MPVCHLYSIKEIEYTHRKSAVSELIYCMWSHTFLRNVWLTLIRFVYQHLNFKRKKQDSFKRFGPSLTIVIQVKIKVLLPCKMYTVHVVYKLQCKVYNVLWYVWLKVLVSRRFVHMCTCQVGWVIFGNFGFANLAKYFNKKCCITIELNRIKF